MADPKRLVILQRLTDHLESTVSIANGYQFDLAGHVFRGRTSFSDEEPLPAVSILESLNPDRNMREADAVRSSQTEKWVLLVQGWVPDDRANPTDPAHRLMADVKKALAKIGINGRPTPAYFLLGGAVINIRIEGGTVRPPDEVSSRAYFFVRVILDMFEDVADPYRLS